MRKLLVAIVIGPIAWQAWGAYQKRQEAAHIDDSDSSEIAQLLDQEAASDARSPYRICECDSRR